MPVKTTNHISEARQLIKRTMAASLNAGAEAHVAFSQSVVPVDEGRLKESIRVEQVATEARPVAVVVAGGIEIDGKLVDYAELVELGRVTSKGTHVAAQPYFTPGIEVAREAIIQVAHASSVNVRFIVS